MELVRSKAMLEIFSQRPLNATGQQVSEPALIHGAGVHADLPLPYRAQPQPELPTEAVQVCMCLNAEECVYVFMCARASALAFLCVQVWERMSCSGYSAKYIHTFLLTPPSLYAAHAEHCAWWGVQRVHVQKVCAWPELLTKHAFVFS